MANSSQHDAKSLHQAISRLAADIAAKHRNTTGLLVLGIANGGVTLSQRIVQLLKNAGLKPGAGTLDISFHRDDIGRNPIPKEFAPTLIPHDVNGATVVLVDDVLHSGRTVKAALDELFDHGRPSNVELAVLADRGGRLMPVAATYTGITLVVDDAEKVKVRLDADDPKRDALVIEKISSRPKTVSQQS